MRMFLEKKNHVIVIPGLGNGVSRHILATNSWKKWGVQCKHCL